MVPLSTVTRLVGPDCRDITNAQDFIGGLPASASVLFVSGLYSPI